jgi:nucleoside phosphorylase/ribosomal protein S15P/S13E
MNQKILNSNMSIRWVVALKVEAEIILDEYNMNFDPEFTLFQVFRNFEKTRWLILSGIGRHNSAAATTYLYMISKASRSTCWINLGIAGSGKGHYGDLCLVNKISNNDSSNTYPATMPKVTFHKMNLFTTDVPLTDYTLHELIDMEGSAFYDITNKLSGREFICLMKVISDGPNNNIEDLNKFKIRELIKLNIANIKTIVSYYEKLSMDQYQIIQQPKILSEILSQWHFSVSQTHQLENLIKRINTLSKDEEITKLIKDCKNSRSVITILEEKILNTKVDWSLV